MNTLADMFYFAIPIVVTVGPVINSYDVYIFQVSAFSTWEKELHKIVFDPRYLLLTSKERKQVLIIKSSFSW